MIKIITMIGEIPNARSFLLKEWGTGRRGYTLNRIDEEFEYFVKERLKDKQSVGNMRFLDGIQEENKNSLCHYHISYCRH